MRDALNTIYGISYETTVRLTFYAGTCIADAGAAMKKMATQNRVKVVTNFNGVELWTDYQKPSCFVEDQYREACEAVSQCNCCTSA